MQSIYRLIVMKGLRTNSQGVVKIMKKLKGVSCNFSCYGVYAEDTVLGIRSNSMQLQQFEVGKNATINLQHDITADDFIECILVSRKLGKAIMYGSTKGGTLPFRSLLDGFKLDTNGEMDGKSNDANSDLKKDTKKKKNAKRDSSKSDERVVTASVEGKTEVNYESISTTSLVDSDSTTVDNNEEIRTASTESANGDNTTVEDKQIDVAVESVDVVHDTGYRQLYENVKDELEALLDSSEKEEALNAFLPEGRFVKLDDGKGGYYVVGTFVTDGVMYIAYGVKGEENAPPSDSEYYQYIGGYHLVINVAD